jgi:hypothetical protein
MPNYDASQFYPPAPVAHVTLRNPSTAASVSEIHLLIDSGADVKLLPRRAVEMLNVPFAEQLYELIGFDGSKSRVQAASLEMILLGRMFQGRYLLIDDVRGILGRDVLNHIAIILDGPHQEWSEQADQ